MKITLKDIAEDTGYSISTVSRVLNGEVKSDTAAKEKILKSAKRMQYVTTRERTGELITRNLNVALIASGFHAGEFYTSFFHGMNVAANDNGVRLHLIGLINPKEELIDLLKEISNYHYDAIILFVPELERAAYQAIKDELPNDFPVISNAHVESPVLPTVVFDGYSGGHMVAEYFRSCGHQQVGIIKGSMERSESRFRFNGFRDCIQHNSDMELIWEYNGDYTFESGLEAFKDYESVDIKPEAIFASNDDMCNAFLESAKQKNIKVPDKLSIVGYDDLQLCEHNQPTISSVKTDYLDLGKATIKTLHDRLSNPNQHNNLLSFVNVSLEVRESSRQVEP